MRRQDRQACFAAIIGSRKVIMAQHQAGRARFAGRLSAVAALAAALLALVAGPALAQSCRTLETQLAQLRASGTGTPSARYLQYDRAVNDQIVQIRKTERAAQLNGCRLIRSRACNRINDSLSRMESNLEQLRRERDRLAPRGRDTTAAQQALLNEMRMRGCEQADYREASLPSNEPPRRRSLLEQIFGVRTYSERGSEFDYEAGRMNLFGTYRTLCVRTCDGYYFPISFSTTQDRFAEDQATCQAMCPGTETRLFVHEMPGGDAETAISWRTGEAYASLENAFSYRRELNPACGCQRVAPQFEEIAGAEIRQVEPDRPRVGLPQFRVDRAMDEETLENLEGGLTLARLAALSGGETETAGGSRRGPIRVVGPAFFPVQ